MAIEAIRQAKRALKHARRKTLEVLVHPQVAVRLLQEERPSLSALERQTGGKILVLSDPSLHYEQIRVNIAGEAPAAK
jgi:Ribonuclease G/E